MSKTPLRSVFATGVCSVIRHMDIKLYFFLVFVIVVTYVVIGNLVYLRNVIPTLEKERLGNKMGNVIPSGMPSRQRKHMKQYLRILDENNLKPWFYYYLKFNDAIGIVIFVFFISLLIKLWGKI